MNRFRAHLFDGRTADAHPVEVAWNDGELVVHGQDRAQRYPLSRVAIAPPLGGTPRALRLPDGGRCETTDAPAVTRLETALRRNRPARLVHRLETGWRPALACLAALVVTVAAFVHLGIPLLARQAAAAVPPAWLESVSRRTLSLLDRRVFAPSRLDAERTAAIEDAFARVVADIGSEGIAYRLAFRHSPAVGPNAFALPSGLVVVTDQLVSLDPDPRGLTGVLAHEVGHIEARHGLRSVFQDAGVFLLVSALVGDVASMTTVAATLPTVLIEAGYARRFETEADLAAGRYLLDRGWSTEPYRRLLARLAEARGDTRVPAFFASHPGESRRIAALEALEARHNPKNRER